MVSGKHTKNDARVDIVARQWYVHRSGLRRCSSTLPWLGSAGGRAAGGRGGGAGGGQCSSAYQKRLGRAGGAASGGSWRRRRGRSSSTWTWRRSECS